MPHTHDRSQPGDVTGRRLGWSVLLTVAFVVGEATAGVGWLMLTAMSGTMSAASRWRRIPGAFTLT